MKGVAAVKDLHRRSGERELWAAVILQQLKDLCSRNAGDRLAAERWVSSGAPFAMVCAMAGLEPEPVRRRLREVVALPLPERRRRFVDRYDTWEARRQGSAC